MAFLPTARIPRGKRARLQRLSRFDGGESSQYSPDAWPHKYSAMLQNCYINHRKNIAKIPGYSAVNSNSTGSYLDAGHEFVKADSTKHILVSGDGEIFKLDPATNEFTNVRSGMNPGPAQYTTVNNECIVATGSNKLLKTSDGTTFTIMEGVDADGDALMPHDVFMAHAHKGRVWYLHLSDRMIAYHSELGNPDSIEGYIDFRSVLQTGDEIVNSFTYIDLHIFEFKNHIAVYSGSTPSDSVNPDNIDYKLIQLIEGTGGISAKLALGLGTDVAIPTRDGVKTFQQVATTGSLKLGNISDEIDDDLQSSLLDTTELSAAHYKRLGWLVWKFDDILRVYDYKKKTWSRIVGADCNAMFTTQDGKMYFVGNAGYLYEYNTPNAWDFAGTNPEFKWVTGYASLTKSGNQAALKLMKLLAYPSEAVTLQMALKYDLGNAMTHTTSNIDLSPGELEDFDSIANVDAVDTFDEVPFQRYKKKLHGRGSAVQMEFTNTSDKYIEIADISLLGVEGTF